MPWELSKHFLSGDFKEKYDIMVSYSSLEHGGLGRFGDAMHPWGDLVTVAKAWCLVKEGGNAIIAVPTAKQDTIEYNAHKYNILSIQNILYLIPSFLDNSMTKDNNSFVYFQMLRTTTFVASLCKLENEVCFG